MIYEPLEAKKAIKKGLASNYTLIFNDHFLIVGPVDNLAKVNNRDSPANAFSKISKYGENNANKKAFLSRNDFSGTNIKERLIWTLINKNPFEDNSSWYLKHTVFPEDALLKADVEKVYTMTDWGTWLRTLEKIKNLKIYIQGGDELLNPCVALLQNKPKLEVVDFLNYLISERAQKLIRDFGKEKNKGKAFFTDLKNSDFDN